MKKLIKNTTIATLAVGTMMSASSAFAENCDKIASVSEVKVEKDWVAVEGTNKIEQSGPEKIFVEIKMPDCEGDGVVAVIPTAEQVFDSIRSYRDGSMHPNDVTRQSMNAYYDAADILKQMKTDPTSFGLRAEHVNYSTDMGLSAKIKGLKKER